MKTHLLVSSVSDDKSYIVLCRESDAFRYIGSLGDIDCIIDIVAQCTRYRSGQERIAALVRKEGCHC